MKYVYKVVSAVLALAVLPLMIFLPCFYYYFSSVALQTLFTIGQLTGSETIASAMQEYGLTSAPKGISESLSLYDIFETVKSLPAGEGGEISEVVQSIIPTAAATAFTFILIAVCAVLTAILAFACKDNRKVIASSFAGIGFSVMFTIIFESLVEPFINGTIGINEILGIGFGSLLAEAEVISISTAFYLIPVIFGCVALWTVLYNATLPEKEKEERKKLIG